MKTKNVIGLKELRENMETYITKIQKGEQVTVFRRSTPLFVLSPVDVAETDWETVIDFTDIHKEGVSARDILASLKTMHGKNSKVS
jgi:antitoxin (DNA-binding transcriptional repressor) of toxin-antitoxin stability system